MKLKISWDHVAGDLIFVAILGGIVGIMAFKGFQKLGIFSYNGLPEADVIQKYMKFQHMYEVFSKVGGHNPLLGGYFERGVAFPKIGGVPYYFHYSNDGKGKAEFSIYPEILESWVTDPGIFGIGKWFTGHVIV